MKIVVCADDYGLSPAVSSGVCQALAAGRISATSVMPLPPFWPAEAAALIPYLDHADIGLHLTLTDLTPLGSMPRLAPEGRLPTLAQLMAWAKAGTLPREDIRQEIERQFDAFEQALGRAPDHLDGHHYAHHLPGIRDLAAEALRARAPGAYVRRCHTAPSVIHRRGLAVAKAESLNEREKGFAATLESRGLPGNRGFTGLYDFGSPDSYAALFPRFLEGMGQGALLVCHPGHVDAELAQRDSLTWRREEELAWLLGDAYPAVLEQYGVEISMFCEIF